MRMNSGGKSEVARVLLDIQQNCEAMARVMNDPAFSTKHAVIQERYRILEKNQAQLAAQVGEEQANALTYNIYTDVMEKIT